MIPCLFAPINPSPNPTFLQRSLFLATATFTSFNFSPMESLTLLKFWKSSAARVSSASSADKCIVAVVDADDEDSFFELELTLPLKSQAKTGRIADFISDEKAEAKIAGKPQSPISILKQSAPKLRVFFLGRLIKKPKAQSEPTDFDFAVNKKFIRSDSANVADANSRRFDSVSKYLNLIKKPLSVKRAIDNSVAAPFASPRKSEDRVSGNGSGNSRFRAPAKNFKSRSAGAVLVSAPSDDSLAQQNDGIQGAILHCKQSFNSSSSPIERRVMSRSGSDTSHEKTNQTSTE